MTAQYKYIRGLEIISDEHMLSATELARMYGLQTVNGKPNAMLVSHLINDYVCKNNINVFDHYYAHSHGVMKVYPYSLYAKPLGDFVNIMQTLGGDQEREYTSKYPEKRTIKFKYKKP